MTAKEYLSQYGQLQQEINAKLERIRRLHEAATRTTQILTLDKVQSSRENKMERIIARITDMSSEIYDAVLLLQCTQKAILGTIESIQNVTQRTVLERRYLNGEKWEEIAVNMNYGYAQICRIHGKALIEIEKMIRNDTVKCDTIVLLKKASSR